MSSDKEKVLAKYPDAYVCREQGERELFITIGPLQDLSGKFLNAYEAWADAARRIEDQHE